MKSVENELNKHIGVLGGYWKCEDCGLLIEDELFVCPECQFKKTDNLDFYVGVNDFIHD